MEANTTLKEIMDKYSWQKRLNILRKMLVYLRLTKMLNKHKRGQLRYAFEYMLEPQNLLRFIKQGDLLYHCDKRREKDTNGEKKNFGDNSRGIEKMRKDTYPLEWIEVSKGGELFFKYNPFGKKNICETICEKHKYKKDSFSQSLIKEKLAISNYKCSITGIPQENGDLAADHFIPKEKGGLSTADNCIILNKILNEKKNKKMPIEWFCETLLTNFMNLCKSVGILEECKEKVIQFIQDF